MTSSKNKSFERKCFEGTTGNWHCCAQGSLETFSSTVFHAYSGRGYAFHFSLNKSKCCCIAGHFPHSEECR